MDQLVSLVAHWQTFLVILGVFGFAPKMVLRAFVHIYPKDDLRRSELLAPLDLLDYWERPLYVAKHLEISLFEGVAARLRRRRETRTAQPDSAVNATVYPVTVQTVGSVARVTVLAHGGSVQTGPAESRAIRAAEQAHYYDRGRRPWIPPGDQSGSG